MLYVVRDVTIDVSSTSGYAEKLPQELLGAIVILETGKKTSTALVVKSIDAIYKGEPAGKPSKIAGSQARKKDRPLPVFFYHGGTVRNHFLRFLFHLTHDLCVQRLRRTQRTEDLTG